MDSPRSVTPAQGTTPVGLRDEEQAARWVRGMFGRIAPRYDLLNGILSFQIDRYWRWYTVRRVRPWLSKPNACVLDLCCGSGSLTVALERARHAPIMASDFCHPMLLRAQQRSRSPLVEADGLRLPLPDASLDLITIAFGFRNFTNYQRGLLELRRVLRPGGALAILEFSQPTQPWFAALYQWYSRHVLPRLGGWISGTPEAYTYLPESVSRFPDAPELAVWLREAGFASVEYTHLTGGIAALHVARVE